MIASSSSAPLTPVTFMYDCEVDGIQKETANITEVCLRIDRVIQNYFITYMKKPESFNYAGPFQKPIPKKARRYETGICLSKMGSFISKNIGNGQVAILMGYNVKGWDEPVLRANCERFGGNIPFERLRFFDIADVARHLGYPKGTTQQQLENALEITGRPANRHRAHADVKVASLIWQKMTKEIAKHPERVAELNAALVTENPELNVANILKKYDETLIASPEAVQKILQVKEKEKLPRLEVIVLYDLETSRLLPKERTNHDVAIRILQAGFKILSRYSGNEYNESFETLINPGRVSIDPKATEVHGIKEADLVGKPSLKEAMESVESWIKNSNTFKKMQEESGQNLEPRIVLVGYNNMHFDNVVLTEEELLYGVDLKRQFEKGVKKSYDLMMLMSTWYTGKSARPENNKLQTHARFLGIPEDDAHRAMGDVRTLEKVIQRICHPINPALIIPEAMKFPGSPGKAAKAIITNALLLIQDPDMEHEEAVKEAADMYEQQLVEEAAEKEEPLKKKRKLLKDNEVPDSQELLVSSQPIGSQPLVYI